jgi:hypothetical protein
MSRWGIVGTVLGALALVAVAICLIVFYPMINWTAMSAGAASIAVIVTLALFIASNRRKEIEEKARVKSEAISRILDTMERSVLRNQTVLSSLRFWANPDLEYALTIPRLIHDLGPDNALVWQWALSQTTRMKSAKSEKEAATIGVEMCMKIVEWGHGQVTDQWFKSEISQVQPPSGRALKWSQTVRGLDRTKNSLIALAILAVMAKALHSAGKTLFSP